LPRQAEYTQFIIWSVGAVVGSEILLRLTRLKPKIGNFWLIFLTKFDKETVNMIA